MSECVYCSAETSTKVPVQVGQTTTIDKPLCEEHAEIDDEYDVCAVDGCDADVCAEILVESEFRAVCQYDAVRCEHKRDDIEVVRGYPKVPHTEVIEDEF